VGNAAARPPARAALQDAAICDGLAERGFAVVEDFCTAEEVAALRAEAERRRAAGELHGARVGRGARAQRDASVRGDEVCWLDAGCATLPERGLLARWDALRRALNRELFLGLVELEAHYARYEPGAGYTRHLDRFRDDDARAISLVLYLNEDWREADGGALRLFAGERASEAAREVLPCAGTLVALRSDAIAHEVAPTRRERWSVAGWLRRRSARESAR
jgi:SM-20-related protein